MAMNMKIIDKMIRTAAVAAFISGAAFAQDGERVRISDVGLRAGPRGLIFVVDGAGPMRVDVPPNQAAQYQELRVTVNNGGVDGGRQTFTPPAELPVQEIILEESQGVLLITAKMRGVVNGPVDLRGGGTKQVRVMLTRDPQPEVNWSASGGAVRAAAGEIRAEPVDMKKIEERAVKDTQASAAGDMFSVKELPRGQRPPAPPAGGAPQIARRTETPLVPAETDSTVAEAQTPSEQELVRYRVYGRDPFVPLVRDTTDTDLPRVENLRLVGVLEDARERIALVEDFKNGNRAFALRANDAVEHGKVLRVQRDRVVFLIRDFDVSRSYTLSISTGR